MKALPRFLTSPLTAFTAAALVVLYVAAGFLLVPRLVASATRSYFETHYHRRVELGHVAFNPLTLKLALDQFAVPDADGAPMLSFTRLELGLSLVSLVRGGLDLGEVALERPRARLVRRADGHLNIMDLVPPRDPHDDPNAAPPRLWIHALVIRDGEASIVDRQPHGGLNLTLRPITFTLRDFSTRSEGNAYRLVASSAQGERFEWLGTFGIRPLVSKGRFKIDRLQVPTLTANGLDLAPLELTAGELRLAGSYDFAEHDDTVALQAQVAELLVTSLAVRAKGERDSWVEIPRLAVTDTTIDVAAATVRVGQVRVERPSLKAWRDRDGSLNLSRLVATGAGDAGGSPPAARPWQLTVPEIHVSGADVMIEDRSLARPATLHLAPVELGIGGYASPARGPLTVTLDSGVNDGGHLTATGSLTIAPLSGRFALEARALGLAALQPYLEQTTALSIKSGTASLQGVAMLGPAGAVALQGDIEVDDLRTVDQSQGEDFINWKSLRFNGLRAQSAPASLSIREVIAREPYARLIIGANGVTNVRVALKQPAPPDPGASTGVTAAATATPPPAADPAATARMPVEIGIVRILNGSMNFADLSVKPSFTTGIHELAGTVKGLSSKRGARAVVDLAGKVDRYAPVTITGAVNFLAAVAYTDVTMSFKNMELTGLSPYSGRFAGFRIDKGKLSADLNYHVENRVLTAKHKLSINQLQLGDRVDSADATKLPVKFAIALLKDRNGVIDIELPVTGSLDDPQFQLGPVLWKLVLGTLSKIVTSPFALLGSLFGGSSELEFIDFPPGSAELDAANRAKLAALVKALDSRPTLNVDVPAVVAPAVDSAVLAAQQWRVDIDVRARTHLGARAREPGAIERLLASPKDYRTLLEDAYRERFGHAAVPPANAAAPGTAPSDPLVAAIAWLEGQLRGLAVVGPRELGALADARAAAVQSALLDGTGADPTRVFIIKAAPLASADAPVRMQLALH